MIVYELVNPSDPWTFEASSDKIAWLVSLYVGRGKTPASRDGWQSPFYFGGDPAKDYEREFGEFMEDAPKRYKAFLVESLRSFMLHRDTAPEKLAGDALAKWNDKHRSSINDFGTYALRLADTIAEL